MAEKNKRNKWKLNSTLLTFLQLFRHTHTHKRPTNQHHSAIPIFHFRHFFSRFTNVFLFERKNRPNVMAKKLKKKNKIHSQFKSDETQRMHMHVDCCTVINSMTMWDKYITFLNSSHIRRNLNWTSKSDQDLPAKQKYRLHYPQFHFYLRSWVLKKTTNAKSI